MIKQMRIIRTDKGLNIGQVGRRASEQLNRDATGRAAPGEGEGRARRQVEGAVGEGNLGGHGRCQRGEDSDSGELHFCGWEFVRRIIELWMVVRGK